MGTLFVVSTPIGNLEDVTPRALRVLAEADLVLAEDTRRTRVLLDRHDIRARPLSLHAHNEASRVARALEVLGRDGVVALVSDAGTPLISDPGERLVEAAARAGHGVSPVPGASAVLAALSVSGLPTVPFSFVGFLPRRTRERRARLESLAAAQETLVLFESPRRTGATLRELASVFGERRACVARELTKLHEEVVRGNLAELSARFADPPRGEVTIVVQGAPAPRLAPEVLDRAIRTRLGSGESPRAIAAALAGSGATRSQVYARALALRRELGAES